MLITTCMEPPPYMSVYEVDYPNLIDRTHDDLDSIIKELLPPLIDCVVCYGFSISESPDDSVYQYAEELYIQHITTYYHSVSEEKRMWLDDYQSGVINLIVYLALDFGGRIHRITPHHTLGVRVHDVSYLRGRYLIKYDSGYRL